MRMSPIITTAASDGLSASRTPSGPGLPWRPPPQGPWPASPGPVRLPGREVPVWWTGRVAIGLRFALPPDTVDASADTLGFATALKTPR